jgi:glycosyltransferase involved in cell wall biosynthesis
MSKHLYVTRAPRVRRALRGFGPDVVFAPYLISNGLAAALAWNGPLLVSAFGADVLEQAGRRPAPPWLHQRLVRFICRRSPTVHAVSDELADALVEMGIDRKRIACFPIGVDLPAFEAAASSSNVSPADIICIRRQEPVYENHVLVEALARLRDQGRKFRCTLVGGGVLMEERQAQVRRLGLDEFVTFTGQIPNEQVRAHLVAAQVYVSASSSDGTSASLLEAMAAGLFPVVTRISANLPWIREGETGLFFGVGNAGELAAALAIALDDPQLRSRATQENRRLVEEKGSQQANMARMLEIMSRAIANGRH